MHELAPAAELLHGDDEVVYGDAGYQGIAKRPEMACKATEFRVAMRPGKCRALPDTPDGRLEDLIETAKAHIRSKVEHPFRVIKQQFGFQKTRLRGLALLRPKAERGGATGTAARSTCWQRCRTCRCPTAIARNSLTRGLVWLKRAIQPQELAQKVDEYEARSHQKMVSKEMHGPRHSSVLTATAGPPFL